MGIFRRYKLSDYTADQCRQECAKIVRGLQDGNLISCDAVEWAMVRWAEYRELLARHEGANQSPMDTET